MLTTPAITMDLSAGRDRADGACRGMVFGPISQIIFLKVTIIAAIRTMTQMGRGVIQPTPPSHKSIVIYRHARLMSVGDRELEGTMDMFH